MTPPKTSSMKFPHSRPLLTSDQKNVAAPPACKCCLVHFRERASQIRQNEPDNLYINDHALYTAVTCSEDSILRCFKHKIHIYIRILSYFPTNGETIIFTRNSSKNNTFRVPNNGERIRNFSQSQHFVLLQSRRPKPCSLRILQNHCCSFTVTFLLRGLIFLHNLYGNGHGGPCAVFFSWFAISY